MYRHLELQSDRKNLSFYHGFPFTVMGYHQKTLMVGSINSLCQILELFSRSNCKLKRERSELRDRVNL